MKINDDSINSQFTVKIDSTNTFVGMFHQPSVYRGEVPFLTFYIDDPNNAGRNLEVGKLWAVEGKFSFEGNAEESSKSFFSCVNSLLRNQAYIKKEKNKKLINDIKQCIIDIHKETKVSNDECLNPVYEVNKRLNAFKKIEYLVGLNCKEDDENER